MQAAPAFGLGCLVGVVGLYVVLQFSSDDVTTSPPAIPAVESSDGVHVLEVEPGRDGASQDVLTRLEELTREVSELRASVEARPQTERVAVQAPRGSGVSVEQLVAALELVERRKLETMDDEELLRRARQESRPEGDVGEAILRYEELLRRDLDPKQRVEAMAGLAMQLRRKGSPESLLASERTYRDMIRENGETSEVGRRATYQLIWTLSAKGDKVRALDLARNYTSRLADSEQSRMQGRWVTAIMLEATGDKAGAKASYQSMLRDLANGSSAVGLTEDIERRLANL